MHGSRHFRKTLQSREMGILDRFYANDPDPFRFEMSLQPAPEETSTSSSADQEANT
jgi:hypothetical protein